MFDSDVWRWGAVDVKGSDGLIRRGMIRDLDPYWGMTVDFDYPDHHADVVPFSRCVTLASTGTYTAGDAVEVLLRHSPQQPWCWHAATLLAGSWNTYAFVEVKQGEETLREVLALERVRAVAPRVPLRWKDKFHKYEVDLPKNSGLLAVTKEDGFWQRWNDVTGTRGVKIDGEKLVYISAARRAMTKLECTQELHRLTNPPAGRGMKRTANDENIPSPNTLRQFTLGDFWPSFKALDAPPPCINTDLPPEMLSRIFSFLDMDEQIKSRRVCHTWNTMLNSSPISLRAQIDVTNCTDRMLATILHKTVTESTKILVLTGRFEGYDKFSQKAHAPFRTAMDMLKAKQIKLSCIVISGRAVWADDLLDYSDRQTLKFRTGWRDVCEKLVLEKVGIHALCEAQDRCNAGYGLDRDADWERYGTQSEEGVMVSRATVRMDGRHELGTLLDLLEESSKEVENTERALVEKKLHADYGKCNQKKREHLLSVLKKWQIGDARFRPDVTWSQLDFRALDVSSLRKLTVAALLYRTYIPADDEEDESGPDGIHIPWQDRYRVMCGLEYDDDAHWDADEIEADSDDSGGMPGWWDDGWDPRMMHMNHQ
ncbi:uncharacterized protein LOC129591951 [Paramacrobiotus metropolitanus]|uniref:uncharacterized protein LOC129591951 n=1 Tax=Paramacrobiotus metropolitanus TaxID=2943436 RepID=UPI00244609E7|nr:uncharacterized protein LOC129591951 [Paramacrobiotus metropolitanus]